MWTDISEKPATSSIGFRQWRHAQDSSFTRNVVDIYQNTLRHNSQKTVWKLAPIGEIVLNNVTFQVLQILPYPIR